MSQSTNGLQKLLNNLKLHCDQWNLKVNIQKNKKYDFNKSGKVFGTKESYFDSKFKFLLIRISRDHISLQYKRMGLTQASKILNQNMIPLFQIKHK
jgi:hypothetical protein